MRNYPDEEGKAYPFYYHGTQKFANCLKNATEQKLSYDAVIIMLGTNDSGKENGAKTWEDHQKEDYINEAESLMQAIMEHSPDARFVLMNVPHRCDTHKPSEGDAAIRVLQSEAVDRLSKKGYRISLFDMHEYTLRAMGNGHGDTAEGEIEAHADYYNIRTETGKPDRTHPNYRGYNRIAEGVRAMLETLFAD